MWKPLIGLVWVWYRWALWVGWLVGWCLFVFCLFVYFFIFFYLCLFVLFVFIYTYLFVFICVCLFVFVCLCLCVFVFVYLFVFVYFLFFICVVYSDSSCLLELSNNSTEMDSCFHRKNIKSLLKSPKNHRKSLINKNGW